MTKEEAIEMIDKYKNDLVHPVMMLRWTCLRVIINQITEEEWTTLLKRAEPILRS